MSSSYLARGWRQLQGIWRLPFSLPSAPSGRSMPTPQANTGQEHTQLKPFEAFFWRYERRIFSFLWRMTGDEQLALDLNQETFIRAW
jgi:hypothetical protein